MVKRIIAVCCVLVMTVLIFAACEKKPPMEEINGIEKAVAYDEEGNTVVNSQGQLRVYSLDEKGYIQYEEDGTPVYSYVNLPSIRADGQTVDTDEYSLTMPEGWETNSAGVFSKNGTDGKCTVSMGLANSLEDSSFDAYIQENRMTNEENVQKVKEQYPNYTVDMSTENFLLAERNAYAATYIIKDENGKVVHYAVMIYYSYEGQAYFINYICKDGIGYDESFDFTSYIKENYVIK